MSAPVLTLAKRGEAVVAPGRTVIDADGKSCGPGATVKLPPAEFARLRMLGFVLGEGESAPPPRTGPTVSASDGPTVRLA